MYKYFPHVLWLKSVQEHLVIWLRSVQSDKQSLQLYVSVNKFTRHEIFLMLNFKYLKICPYLNWRWMFLTFGCIGFIWVLAWITSFKEIKLIEDDEYIIVPPKVSRITHLISIQRPPNRSILVMAVD